MLLFNGIVCVNNVAWSSGVGTTEYFYNAHSTGLEWMS